MKDLNLKPENGPLPACETLPQTLPNSEMVTMPEGHQMFIEKMVIYVGTTPGVECLPQKYFL